MRQFTVQKGVMGYVVTIGCQVAGFSTKEDLIKAITEYVTDPEATEKKHYPTNQLAGVPPQPDPEPTIQRRPNPSLQGVNFIPGYAQGVGADNYNRPM